MEFKPKNRAWVKDAAIVFLAIMLVLTFFSNTIRNRALVEVATTAVTDGNIVAKVRGTGTVVANGLNQVMAGRTVEIKAVMVKSGQDVSAGDVLFVLGAGESEELETAREELRSLELSYQRAVVGLPNTDYGPQREQIKAAEEAVAKARLALEEAEKIGGIYDEPILIAKNNVEAAENALAICEDNRRVAGEKLAPIRKAYDDGAPQKPTEPTMPVEPLPPVRADGESDEDFAERENQYLVNKAKYDIDKQSYDLLKANYDVLKAEYDSKIAAYNQGAEKKALDEAQALYDAAEAEVVAATEELKKREAEFDALMVSGGQYVDRISAAQSALSNAETHYYALVSALETEKESDNKSAALTSLELQDLTVRMEKLREEIKLLSGEEGEEITAKVSGRIDSIECTAGQTVTPEQVLCTIEVPDMGYTLSFSVTNDQARRLRVGESTTVNNYYWGQEIIATLSTIKTDPKNPQGSKLLTFDVTGDVNAGTELTIAIGQKSANYDTVIPNSSIRTDSNGSFVLVIVARNSPLGNMYEAKRVNVEVLAADDVNSAVTAELSYGDFVITTSNGPVKSGDQVRLADKEA